MKPKPPLKRNPKPKEVTGKVKEASKIDEQFAFFSKVVEERIFFGTVIYPNFKNESDLTAYKERIKKLNDLKDI